MEVTVVLLRALDALHGLTRTDAELEAAVAAAQRTLDLLASMDTVAIDPAADPAMQFRTI